MRSSGLCGRQRKLGHEKYDNEEESESCPLWLMVEKSTFGGEVALCRRRCCRGGKQLSKVSAVERKSIVPQQTSAFCLEDFLTTDIEGS